MCQAIIIIFEAGNVRAWGPVACDEEPSADFTVRVMWPGGPDRMIRFLTAISSYKEESVKLRVSTGLRKGKWPRKSIQRLAKKLRPIFDSPREQRRLLAIYSLAHHFHILDDPRLSDVMAAADEDLDRWNDLPDSHIPNGHGNGQRGSVREADDQIPMEWAATPAPVNETSGGHVRTLGSILPARLCREVGHSPGDLLYDYISDAPSPS